MYTFKFATAGTVLPVAKLRFVGRYTCEAGFCFSNFNVIFEIFKINNKIRRIIMKNVECILYNFKKIHKGGGGFIPMT